MSILDRPNVPLSEKQLEVSAQMVETALDLESGSLSTERAADEAEDRTAGGRLSRRHLSALAAEFLRQPQMVRPLSAYQKHMDRKPGLIARPRCDYLELVTGGVAVKRG